MHFRKKSHFEKVICYIILTCSKLHLLDNEILNIKYNYKNVFKILRARYCARSPWITRSNSFQTKTHHSTELYSHRQHHPYNKGSCMRRAFSHFLPVYSFRSNNSRVNQYNNKELLLVLHSHFKIVAPMFSTCFQEVN